MAFEWESFGAFGGGLDFTKHPAALRADQWSWSDGWIARDGCAETATDLTLHATIPGLASTEQIIGLVQRVWGQDGAVVGVVNSAGTMASRLFTVTGAGTVTEITAAGGFNPLLGNQSAVFQSAFLGGQQVFNFGWFTSPLATSLCGWTGGATYTPIQNVSTGLQWHHLAGFQAHLIGAAGSWAGIVGVTETGQRLVGWGPANLATFDLPAVANDADFVVMDDVASGVVALVPVGANLCAIFSRGAIHALVPTGGIPAFQRQLIAEGIGMLHLRTSDVTSTSFRSQAFWGRTPTGVAFASFDNLHLLGPGGLQPIGTPIFDYWSRGLYPTATPTLAYHQTMSWHEALGVLYCPKPHDSAGALARDVFLFDPAESAWSHIQWSAPSVPTGGHYLRSAFIHSYTAAGAMQRQLWVATRTGIYREGGNAIANGVVDTKDFAFGSPARRARVNALKVDWEPLSNAVTDAISVWAAERDDLSRNQLGTVGRDTIVTWRQIGTLTGGASELPCRLAGKFLRLRFRQESGLARIRGFHINRDIASDKPKEGGTATP